MLFGQKVLKFGIYSCILLLILVGAVDGDFLRAPGIDVQLVDTRNAAVNYEYVHVNPRYENKDDASAFIKTFNLTFYMDLASSHALHQGLTACVCMQSNGMGNKQKYCNGDSRICFMSNRCYGTVDFRDLEKRKHCRYDDSEEGYYKYEITVKEEKPRVGGPGRTKAIVVSRRDSGEEPVELDIAGVMGVTETSIPGINIALVTFYDFEGNGGDCGNLTITTCLHKDRLHLDTISPGNGNGHGNGNGSGNTQIPTFPPDATTDKSNATTTPTAAIATASSDYTALYICIGIFIAILIIAIILIVLRCVQGQWCCGLLCCRKKESEEEGQPQKKYKFTSSKDGPSKIADAPPPAKEPEIMQGLKTDEIVNRSADTKITFEGNVLQPTQSLPTADEKKATDEVKKEEKKDEKTSKSSSSSGPETKEKPTKEVKPSKRQQAPNMLLVATKEDDTQSEGQIPSKRKTKVEKNHNEPAPTKNVTLDPGTKGLATGKPAATTMKTGLKKTEAKTGLPKSETELVTDQDRAPGTKGVSATQVDKGTLNVETGPTQQTRTMATGAAKGTTMAPTQLGTQTTQGGATTAGGKTNFMTGVGKTRATGPTQIPSADTNETQNPTGATGTKTKPTQFPTGTTQIATGATQKTGTTQAATGTTQRGTTMATGMTKQGTAPTQARTGTRQTGETQNPEETDIDPTQAGKTSAGGTRPTVAGTQMPSDAEADPTQNPTAFTGGEMRTSKTQLGTAGTKTRTTQKQTKRTDA